MSCSSDAIDFLPLCVLVATKRLMLRKRDVHDNAISICRMRLAKANACPRSCRYAIRFAALHTSLRGSSNRRQCLWDNLHKNDADKWSRPGSCGAGYRDGCRLFGKSAPTTIRGGNRGVRLREMLIYSPGWAAARPRDNGGRWLPTRLQTMQSSFSDLE